MEMEVCVRVAGLGGASHTAVSVEPLGGAAAAVAGLAGDGLARGRLLRRMSEHRRQRVRVRKGERTVGRMEQGSTRHWTVGAPVQVEEIDAGSVAVGVEG